MTDVDVDELRLSKETKKPRRALKVLASFGQKEF